MRNNHKHPLSGYLRAAVCLMLLSIIAASYAVIGIPDARCGVLVFNVLATAGTAWAVGVATVSLQPGISRLSVLTGLTLLIISAPLAVDSAIHLHLMNAGLLALALAVMLHVVLGAGRGSRLLVAALNTAACVLAPTAAVWALAVAVQPGRTVTSDIHVKLSAILGILLSWTLGLFQPAIFPAVVGSDLMILLPTVAVGCAGYTWRLPFRLRRQGSQPVWLTTWCGLCGLGLVMVICGLPLDARILALPFWLAMPWGLERLWQMWKFRAGRALALCCCGAVGLMCMPMMLRLLESGLWFVVMLFYGS